MNPVPGGRNTALDLLPSARFRKSSMNLAFTVTAFAATAATPAAAGARACGAAGLTVGA